MSEEHQGHIYFVMGVSGCGKSTIAPMLAEKLNVPFFDGDDFHPAANVQKMAAKIPLTDKDRHGWLQSLNQLACKHQEEGAVIVCSALKKSHREKLAKGIEDKVVWIFLQGTFDLILSRLQLRQGHFMPIELLQSQFHTLEIPENAIRVSIQPNPDEIVQTILEKLQ